MHNLDLERGGISYLVNNFYDTYANVNALEISHVVMRSEYTPLND